MSVAWLWAAARRRRALLRLLRDAPAAAGTPSASASAPPVSVVLPVKGASAQRLQHWRAQLAMAAAYPGPVEVLFVVEAETDAAVAEVKALQADMLAQRREHSCSTPSAPAADEHPRREAAAWSEAGVGVGPSVRLVVAGSSTRCSQKIHSQRAGAAAAAPGAAFLLFLDDDVWVHAGTLHTLVAAFSARRQESFMVTGYPFDLPPRDGGNLWAYCAMAYHLPLIVAFSQGELTLHNVWGGCMLLPAEALRKRDVGVLDAWGDGAYSDDLILASLAGFRGEHVLCPAEAVFPSQLEGRWSCGRWWNYMRRQLYVLDTYTFPHNRRVNHSLLCAQTYASFAFSFPAVPAAIHALTAASSAFSVVTGKSDAAGAADGACAAARALGVSYWLLFSGALWAASRMYAALIALSAQLSPTWLHSLARPTADACRRNASCSEAASAQWCGAATARAMQPNTRISWPRLALALLVANAVLPACAAWTLLASDIQWAGSTYRKRRGRVERVA